jgi:hypothetical protein
MFSGKENLKIQPDEETEMGYGARTPISSLAEMPHL